MHTTKMVIKSKPYKHQHINIVSMLSTQVQPHTAANVAAES